MNKPQVILIVGARGEGKSTMSKILSKDVHRARFHAYDVQREHELICPFCLSDDNPLPDVDDYLKHVLPMTDSVIVMEESTVFFSSRGSNKKLRQFLVNARHANNLIMLNFHSIRSLPWYIYDLCDLVILFRTNDETDVVEKKHPKLFQAFRILQESPQYALKLKLFNGVMSPYMTIRISR